MSTVDELKEHIIRICDNRTKIVEVLYYPKGSMSVGRKETTKDTIIVIYTWDCLGCSVESRTFQTVEDCVNNFNKNKTSLSDVRPSNAPIGSAKFLK